MRKACHLLGRHWCELGQAVQQGAALVEGDLDQATVADGAEHAKIVEDTVGEGVGGMGADASTRLLEGSSPDHVTL
ncbi:hypothetical protein HC031_19740 [Planosporangium thailandense]|uniref:Uncharacterized protein n=1 Tax=Planosporangium thailandense TaxID=765197 RepID=A0ABX0Y0Q4_9ACTN|nr:hypothetical protein [Planosporangium thailandense]NJC71931.1 hypothetical protein [Planosporangium thailandense]